MAKRSSPTRSEEQRRGDGDDDPVRARLRRHLDFLGLTCTLEALDEHLAWATRERAGPTALLEHVLGVEAAHKLEQRVTRRIDTSGLVERKILEAFDWDFQPTLEKDLVLELARLDFVRQHDDLVITGNNGTGKSHILKAFGLRACEQGIHMRYARCDDLIDDLHAGLADGTCARRLKGWARPDLLIIDDVGLGQVKRAEEPTAAHTLYNLVDRRHGRVSTAMTSNIALSDWGRYLGDATLTAAILDRLAMHAIRIDITGPSWRQHVAKTRRPLRDLTAHVVRSTNDDVTAPLIAVAGRLPAALWIDIPPPTSGSPVELVDLDPAGIGSALCRRQSTIPPPLPSQE